MVLISGILFVYSGSSVAYPVGDGEETVVGVAGVFELPGASVGAEAYLVVAAMAFPCKFAAALVEQLVVGKLGRGVSGQTGTGVDLVHAVERYGVSSASVLAHAGLSLHEQYVGITVDGEVGVGMMRDSVLELELHETGAFAGIHGGRVLDRGYLGVDYNLEVGFGVVPFNYVACPAGAVVDDGVPVGGLVVDGAYEPLGFALVGIGVLVGIYFSGRV